MHKISEDNLNRRTVMRMKFKSGSFWPTFSLVCPSDEKCHFLCVHHFALSYLIWWSFWFWIEMFKFIKFNKFDSDETKKQEKILAGRDLRSKVNSTLELTVSNMTQTAVNELFVEKLSRPSSVSFFLLSFLVFLLKN